MSESRWQSIRRKKAAPVAALLVAAMWFMGAEMSSKSQSLIVDTSRPVQPLFELKVQVPKSGRDSYFSMLTAFALEHEFRIQIATRDAARDWISTDMLGDQVVAMGDNFSDVAIFTIAFLPAIGKSPPATLA